MAGDITGIVVGLITLLLLGWETWTLANKIKGDTESEAIRRAAVMFPVLSVFGGLISGHWFLPRCGPFDPLIAGGVGLGAAVLLLAFIIEPKNLARRIGAGFMCGVAGGYLFWPLCVDPTRGALLIFGILWRC